jgi:hypothetical protein
MTVYLVMSLPKFTVHTPICMALANPMYDAQCYDARAANADRRGDDKKERGAYIGDV